MDRRQQAAHLLGGRLGVMPELELAAAVVILNDHVLLVSRSMQESFKPGQWGVPCGKVDAGETAPQAALRELREETGLRGSVVRRVGRSDFESIWRGLLTTNLQTNFLVSPVIDPASVDADGMPRVTLPQLDQRARWVPADEIGQAGLDPHNLRTVQQGLAYLVRR